uniref:Uncharacterized protein n=1 Tax=Romanomermis culicivorax TaxID=13658 RepID=A0A915J4F4_ROMCU
MASSSDLQSSAKFSTAQDCITGETLKVPVDQGQDQGQGSQNLPLHVQGKVTKAKVNVSSTISIGLDVGLDATEMVHHRHQDVEMTSMASRSGGITEVVVKARDVQGGSGLQHFKTKALDFGDILPILKQG